MHEHARPSSCRSSGKRDVATPTDDTHDDAMGTNGPQGLRKPMCRPTWLGGFDSSNIQCRATSRILDLGSLGPWEASVDRAIRMMDGRGSLEPG